MLLDISNTLREEFDQPFPIVSHFQGGGGDISPGGTSDHGHDFARMEGIGEFAVDALYDLWEINPNIKQFDDNGSSL